MLLNCVSRGFMYCWNCYGDYCLPWEDNSTCFNEKSHTNGLSTNWDFHLSSLFFGNRSNVFLLNWHNLLLWVADNFFSADSTLLSWIAHASKLQWWVSHLLREPLQQQTPLLYWLQMQVSFPVGRGPNEFETAWASANTSVPACPPTSSASVSLLQFWQTMVYSCQWAQGDWSWWTWVGASSPVFLTAVVVCTLSSEMQADKQTEYPCPRKGGLLIVNRKSLKLCVHWKVTGPAKLFFATLAMQALKPLSH